MLPGLFFSGSLINHHPHYDFLTTGWQELIRRPLRNKSSPTSCPKPLCCCQMSLQRVPGLQNQWSTRLLWSNRRERANPNKLSKTTLLPTAVVKCLSKGCQVFKMITQERLLLSKQRERTNPNKLSKTTFPQPLQWCSPRAMRTLRGIH